MIDCKGAWVQFMSRLSIIAFVSLKFGSLALAEEQIGDWLLICTEGKCHLGSVEIQDSHFA